MEIRYSDLRKKIKKTWLTIISKIRFWRTTENSCYHSYETIPLKLYCDIAASGKLERLHLSGKLDQEKCTEAWEQIIKRNSQENGSFEYDSYKQLLNSYQMLMCKHLIDKTLLLKLAHVIDWEALTEIRSRGYKVVTDPPSDYTKTLNAAFSKCNNLITKINIKRGEIERSMPKDKEKGNGDSFDTIMASISMAAAPMIIDENVTLSRFNEIKKVLKRRAELAKQKNPNGRA
jgi:hypothetical protein